MGPSSSTARFSSSSSDFHPAVPDSSTVSRVNRSTNGFPGSRGRSGPQKVQRVSCYPDSMNLDRRVEHPRSSLSNAGTCDHPIELALTTVWRAASRSAARVRAPLPFDRSDRSAHLNRSSSHAESPRAPRPESILAAHRALSTASACRPSRRFVASVTDPSAGPVPSRSGGRPP